MSFRMLLCTSLIFLLSTTLSHAAPITVPTSLNSGDQYRLAFVTSGTRDALSTDIEDYNTFVQAQADAVPELLSLATSWMALGSTATVDARDNTGTNPFVAVGVPIYLLSDILLASDNAGLWNGSLDSPLSVNQFGSPVLATFPFVWTGSSPGGVSSASFVLGASSAARVGIASTAGSQWVSFATTDTVNPLFLYSLSGVLTVAAVPEPSSLILLGLGGIGAMGIGSRRRVR